MKYLIQGVFAVLLFIFSLSGIWFNYFSENQLQILGMLLSLIFSFIIYANYTEEKRENKIFERFEKVVGILMEKFNDKDDMDAHYVKSIEKAKKVEDLTWAPFTNAGKEGAVTKEYINRIMKAAETGTDFDEIFIFNNKEDFRKDRLEKLKYHYENAKKGKNRNQYSCYYFDVTSFDFPRIQFTIVDEDEIIFTSGRNTRFRIKSKELVTVFSDYYREAISKATPLITYGNVVNEDEIKKLINKLEGR